MVEPLARLGYASKALIYAIVGVLAAAAALNKGGRVTDTSGALRVVLSQPYGRGLLLILGIGLCGYAAWRLLDAARDPDRHGTAFGGLVVRIGNAIRGVIYGGLGIEAFRLLRGLRGSNGEEAEMWAGRIMTYTLGDVLLGVVGAIVMIYGASEVIGSLRGKEDPLVDMSIISARARPLLGTIARFGVGARGLIIVTLGYFLVRAAMRHSPAEAAGTRESVVELASAVEGRWMLAFISAGLIAYAIDQAIHARCRRIRPVV